MWLVLPHRHRPRRRRQTPRPGPGSPRRPRRYRAGVTLAHVPSGSPTLCRATCRRSCRSDPVPPAQNHSRTETARHHSETGTSTQPGASGALPGATCRWIGGTHIDARQWGPDLSGNRELGVTSIVGPDRRRWSSAGSGDEGGDDVGGVPVERSSASVVAHRCSRVGPSTRPDSQRSPGERPDGGDRGRPRRAHPRVGRRTGW